MADSGVQRRRNLYFQLSSRIAGIDNRRLQALISQGDEYSGWGQSRTIDLGRSKIFVKRVPVTDLEYDNMFSTENLYDLPNYYHYGLNSAGLGVFRELVTHIKTTNWVLAGAISTFPLMYHYRIVPFSGVHEPVHTERVANYVTYWNGNANVGRYIVDRANAKYELVLFLEHFPHTAASWLMDKPGKIPMVLADMQETIAFLRNKGIIHLDSHFDNIVSDGKRAYLTDFGLVLDKHFDLAPAEQLFFKQNSYYDYGNLLLSLGAQLYWTYRRLPDAEIAQVAEKWGISAEAEFREAITILLNDVEAIAADGVMKLDKNYVTSLVKYRSIITLMYEFFTTMRANDKKDTLLDHAKLRFLLKETGFISGAAPGS